MNVLLISLEYSPAASGGVGTHVEELAAGLARCGKHVTVLSGTTRGFERISSNNLEVHLVPPDASQAPSLSMSEHIDIYNHQLARYAEQEIMTMDALPDIIHCHNWTSYLAAAQLGRRYSRPVITTVHYLSSPVEEWWGQELDPEIVSREKAMLHESKAFIAVSNSIRKLMTEVHLVSLAQVAVVPNGIDLTPFDRDSTPIEVREQLRNLLAPHGEGIVVFAGRLNPMKGIEELLQSAAILLSRGVRVRYVIAGDPDSQTFAKRFRGLVRELPHLEQHLTALGKLSRKQLAALFAVADAVVLPSVFDPSSYVAIEAMAAGSPLVVSASGGLGELINHQQNGLLVNVHITDGKRRAVRPSDLAEATLQLLIDRKQARTFGDAARSSAFQNHTSDGMAKNTHRIYEQVISTT